jgi:hypothetical protein
VRRWSAPSHEQLISCLREAQAYEVELDSKRGDPHVHLPEVLSE